MAETVFYGRSAASQQRLPAPGEGGHPEDEEYIDMRLPTPTTKYREATVGKLLIESLDQLIIQGKITPSLYTKICSQYDRTMLHVMSKRASSRMTFKADKLTTYRLLDGVWTFCLSNVEFREFHCFANVPNLKILAFDGRVPVPRVRSRRIRNKPQQQSS